MEFPLQVQNVNSPEEDPVQGWNMLWNRSWKNKKCSIYWWIFLQHLPTEFPLQIDSRIKLNQNKHLSIHCFCLSRLRQFAATTRWKNLWKIFLRNLRTKEKSSHRRTSKSSSRRWKRRRDRELKSRNFVVRTFSAFFNPSVFFLSNSNYNFLVLS